MSGWRAPLWYDRLAGIAWRAVIVVAALLVLGVVGLSSVILPTALGLLFARGLNPLARTMRTVRFAHWCTMSPKIVVVSHQPMVHQ